MEENNFEKQVQQKMDGLKIPPSDAVWDHVKMNIEKRKSRRWLLLIFLFGGIVLLSGLYYFSADKYSSLDNKLSQNAPAVKAADSLSINGEDISKEKNVSKEENISNEESISKAGNISKEPSAAKNKGSLPKISGNSEFEKGNDHSHNSNAAVDIVDKKKGQNKIKTQGLKEHTNGNVIITITPPQPEVSTLNKTSKQDSTNSVESQPGSIAEKNKIDNLSSNAHKDNTIDSSSHQEIAQQAPVEIDTPLVQKPLRKSSVKNSKKWNVGIVLSGGISHVGNQFLGLGYSSAAYSQNASSLPPGNVSLSNPSKVKNGLGFIAGIFLEKSISAKTKFSFGINYKEFNTSNLVGQRNDSAGSFSSVNADKRYTNNFKFIELPLKVRISLGHSKSLPIFWSGGITISQLIKSNALQFDPYTFSNDPFAKAYFTDNSLFNKTLLGLNTSFSATIFSNKKSSILAGPYFYYAASRLANEGLYSKKHFVFLGLQTQIIFNKK